MKRYTYDTEYGRLVVETDGRNGDVIENTLDADALLSSEEAKSLECSWGIWGHIIIELFGEEEISKLCPPREEKAEWCAGDLTDYGMKFFFKSGLQFQLDHQGAFFEECFVEEDKAPGLAKYFIADVKECIEHPEDASVIMGEFFGDRKKMLKDIGYNRFAKAIHAYLSEEMEYIAD